ncbi:MAG: prephenate dehydrogenase/arogenate dehydrogenase family protein, partial [Clostridia bacterium]|nr:prephenate dehydrogenase/arogenate dehydrogenase family protein [Clostridia bacterium]
MRRRAVVTSRTVQRSRKEYRRDAARRRQRKGQSMKNVGIIGLGLIGGSFAKAVKASGKYTVFGCDKDVKTENAAIKDKAIDFVLTEENAKDIDLLVSAVTVGVFKDATERFLPFLKGGATVIDFGGVK